MAKESLLYFISRSALRWLLDSEESPISLDPVHLQVTITTKVLIVCVHNEINDYDKIGNATTNFLLLIYNEHIESAFIHK